jgi:simple sugar transport system substrate-binding protein
MEIRKKFFALVLASLMLFVVMGYAATPATSEEATQYGDVIPQIFKDKQIKVAIIRNLTADDGTKLMMATCTAIGKSWGWEVDTFITNNDDVKFQETVTQAIQKNYDAIYISHGKKEYSYDLLKPGLEKGIKMVTFDTIALGPNGEKLDGLTSIVQDDQKMAELTLNRLTQLKTNGEPVKLLKLWYGPGGAPALDARNVTYVEFEKAGKIKTIETIGPTNMSDVMGDTANRTAAALSLYKPGEIDAMWGSWDELAKGGLQAVLDAGRTEIKLVTVDC